MTLFPPAQTFTTTLYDRHQPQSLSFLVIPARSIKNETVPGLEVVKDILEPDAKDFQTVPVSYLPAALASLLGETGPDPFAWAKPLPPLGAPIWIHPNSVGFAEYVAFAELIPFEESPLKAKSIMAIAAAAGVKIGLIAGGPTPLVLLTVPAGIILCTAGAAFGPALGQRLAKII
jgi:hypothetical protein